MYEPRRDEAFVDTMPTPAVRDGARGDARGCGPISADDEAELGLPRSREPQLGFVWATYRWARQERLDRVLAAASERGAELSAGDFVRWCKQVLDLLDQLATAPVAGPPGCRRGGDRAGCRVGDAPGRGRAEHAAVNRRPM